jgi:hypothetical protein
MKNARQRGHTAHGKVKSHSKADGKRTAMKMRTAKKKRHCREKVFAVRKARSHGKAAFAVQFCLCRAPCGIFSFFFLLYLF